MRVQIGKDQLNLGVFYPFAFSIDRRLAISDVQPSLAKMFPSVDNLVFTEVFKLKRPWSVEMTYESFLDYANTLFLIEKIEGNIILRGHLIPLPQAEKLLFIGSPWITDAEELVKHGLTLSDFSMSDSVMDMLQMLKVQDLNLKDIQVLHQKIDRQKEFYEKVLNQIPGKLSVLDTFGQTVFQNFSGEEDVQERKELWQKASERKEEVEQEYKVLSEDGRTDYFLRKMRPVLENDGSVKFTIGYSFDITKRRLAEKELRKSEELYRLVIDATNDGIWDWNIECGQVFVNTRLKQMLGHQDLSDSSEELLELIHEEDRQGWKKTVIDHFRMGTPISIPLRFFHHNGSVKWMMCRAFALCDKSGKAYRMVGSITDITDAKETEMALQRAKEAAEESTKAKETFLANMSHEIRTPLNAILGMAKLLDKVTTDSRQKEFLRAIKYSADNLLVIINDILDLAKIDAGKLDFEHVGFDVVEVAKNAAQTLVYKAEEKGISLVTVMPLEQTMVLGDPFRLSQILLNLLNNAIKFTKNGKVELRLVLKETEEGRVVVQFQVADTGIGIPEEKWETIFESFKQANESTTRYYGGTGLGLSICKKLVDLQHGTIRMESKVGVGTTFFVELEFLKSDTRFAEFTCPDQQREFLPFQDVTVLLAEDNEINQVLATELLSSWGCRVYLAANGQEAVESWHRSYYDIILMDIQMPVMGGIEATLRIRESTDELKAKVPIIALTANALKGDKERYVSFGMDDHVAKPFDERALYQKMAALMPNKVPMQDIVDSGSAFTFERLKNMYNGDRGMERKVLGIFLKTIPPLLEQMNEALKVGNAQTLSLLAHKLKTTIYSMAIRPLFVPVSELEQSTREGGCGETESKLLTEIEKVLRKCLVEFAEKLKTA